MSNRVKQRHSEARFETCRTRTTAPETAPPFSFSTTSYRYAETDCDFVDRRRRVATDLGGVRYYGYRYYNPGLGRWVSRDPIWEEGGINVYAINDNCLVCGIDYIGLKRIFYNSKGKKVGSDRWYVFWGTDKFIEGPNGNVEYCGKKYWRVWEYDEEFLPGAVGIIHEKWEPEMLNFYGKYRNRDWKLKYIPLAFLTSLKTVLDNSPHGKDWDYKASLEDDDWYIFNKEAHKFDSIGNITWGAIMESYGWPEWLAKLGGGAFQVGGDYKELMKKKTVPQLRKFLLKNRSKYGDELRDTEAIGKGYKWNP